MLSALYLLPLLKNKTSHFLMYGFYLKEVEMELENENMQ